MTSRQMSDPKHADRPRQAQTDRLKQAVQEVLADDRPWKADIDRLQTTLQEALEAISNFRGGELTGAAPGPEAADPFHLPLNPISLKDRIREDLETFAATTASGLAQQAEREAGAAQAAIESEMNRRLERAAGGFREKLLEPYVEEATGRILESVRRRINDKLAEQEQMAQERIKESLVSLQGRLNRAAQKLRTQGVETNAGELLGNQKSSPKGERLEARVTSEQKRLIEHAAEIRGTSITDLIVAAALDAAARVVKDHDILVLNDGASREFALALLKPPEPRAKAKEAWRRYRKHVAAK